MKETRKSDIIDGGKNSSSIDHELEDFVSLVDWVNKTEFQVRILKPKKIILKFSMCVLCKKKTVQK